MGRPDDDLSPLRHVRMQRLRLAPAWTTDEGQDRPARIILNARLFDDFDLDAVPIRHVDGRNDR